MNTPARTTTLTTLLALAPDLVERDRIRRQALRVGAVRHDGLAPLREAAFAGEGLALTWEIPADADPLSVGIDALAALAPVAAGLALLHDAGLAHGGIAHAGIHVRDGRGVLSGWRPGGSPERDVADLVGVLDACLPPGSVDADVAQVLMAGSDPDAASRPSMARIAATLERASRMSVAVLSPPAHRRGRLEEAPITVRESTPGRATPPVRDRAVRDRAVGDRTASDRAASDRAARDPGRRGRHAAHAAPARPLRLAGVRMPWRWGVAIAGAAAAAFLGFSALGSAGSAQEICPAPASADGLGVRQHTTQMALLTSLTGAAQDAGPGLAR